MSRRMWNGADRIFRGVIVFKDGCGEANPSYYGPYLSAGQARGEITRRKNQNSGRGAWSYEIVDSFVEQTFTAWERVTEVGKSEADKERQSDKDRIAKEQKRDKERAERERPQ